jgi:hypothetical protein
MASSRVSATTANEIIRKSNELKTYWAPRNKKFKDWYSLIEMVDELKADKMESFVGNDPRAAFNLMLGVLDQRIPHRIPSQDLTPELVSIASEVENIFDTIWDDIFTRYRRTGRYWMRTFISFLLATGWYAIFSIPSQDGSRFIAEIWNPASVYQSWDDELIECAHIVDLSPLEARGMIQRAGWKIEPPKGRVTLYDYWWIEQGDKVYNAVVLGTTLVKEPTHESRFKRIPIFTAPVAGLPDTGLLTPEGEPDRWKEEIGQGLPATNENIYRAWNKWWTFSMQLLRDTAQARIIEKNRSGKPIVKPEDVFRRGAIFRMTPEEDVKFLAPPPIPVEIRASQLDMEAMMQRGGPSWALFGNIQQQMSAYVMSQIAASMNHIAKPYHRAIIDAISDIDNFWLDMMRTYGYKPHGLSLPDGLPKDIKITAEYEIKIPGDIIQRATVARMLDPNFELSPIRVMEELFPEIKNPIEEMAKVAAYKAKRHPINAVLTLITTLREQARELEKAGDRDGARLYEKAADKAETMLDVFQEEAPEVRPPSPRPEVVPPTSPAPPVI